MVSLARRVDDGEAEGLAIATSRGYAFCSDDALIKKVALAAGIQTKIVSTPELLQTWAGSDSDRIAMLPDVVRRITTLARFRPHTSSSYAVWWSNQLAC